jgi:hypothetical protein
LPDASYGCYKVHLESYNIVLFCLSEFEFSLCCRSESDPSSLPLSCYKPTLSSNRIQVLVFHSITLRSQYLFIFRVKYKIQVRAQVPQAVLWIRNSFFFGSGSNSNFGSGLFLTNTFELQICRSSKHRKKLIF